jgi:hypothetical protein
MYHWNLDYNEGIRTETGPRHMYKLFINFLCVNLNNKDMWEIS